MRRDSVLKTLGHRFHTDILEVTIVIKSGTKITCSIPRIGFRSFQRERGGNRLSVSIPRRHGNPKIQRLLITRINRMTVRTT